MSYGFEWMPVVALLGAVVLLIVPPFGVLAVLVVALAVVAALIATIIATPYLVVRTVRRHLAERHQHAAHQYTASQSTERSRPIATAVAHAAGAGNR